MDGATYDIDRNGDMVFISTLIGRIYRAIAAGGATLDGNRIGKGFVRSLGNESCEIYVNMTCLHVTYDNALDVAERMGLA